MIETAPNLTADQIQPLNCRVLIRRLKRAEKTAGGIIRAEMSREEGQTGIALGVGPDVRDVQVGDLLVFQKFAAAPCWAVQPGTDDLVFVREQDLLGVIDPSGAGSNGQGG